MSAYNPSTDLPTGIYAPTLVEEQAVWASQVMQFNNPTAAYQEAQNSSQLFCHISPQLRIPNGDLIIVCRNVFIIDEMKDQTLPIWKRIKEFSNTTIPAGFKITG